MKRIVFLTLVWATTVNADINRSWTLLKKSDGDVRSYPQITKGLVESGLYFAAIPYVKEYLYKAKLIQDKKVDLLIDEIVRHVGVKQFEVLPTKFLEKSNAPTLRYILARKYFRTGEYKKSLKVLEQGISKNHPVAPFNFFLKGSAQTILKQYDKAIVSYNQCVDSAEDVEGDAKSAQQKRQIAITKDYCIIGKGRTYFAGGKYEKANLAYLDLSKSSHIWPEILFEEAWNSFYQGNYNRTLGKLVSYKAPVFSYYYNPEIDILRALTFLELCLWADTKKSVDEFYTTYERNYQRVEGFVMSKKRDYKFFYLFAKKFLAGEKTSNELLNKMMSTVTRDPSYRELVESFNNGKDEIEKVNAKVSGRFKSILQKNLRSSLVLQRNLIGSYVRKQLHLHLLNTKKSFKDMSYIKLEVLSRKKRELYGYEKATGRSRGSISNLERTDKQYFWSFNGEFWADELGDYVFSLKSECR